MTILVSKFWFSLLMVGLFASLTFSATTTKPTVKPSVKPSIKPTTIPTMRPSTRVPSRVPSARPSSRKPSIRPSVRPTRLPSIQPSSSPSSKPTSRPTFRPSALPTSRPSSKPSSVPSSKPSSRPSSRPTSKPSYGPKSNSAGSRSKIAPGAVAGIVIAVFVVVAFALYMARNHYNYIQRFINISGLNNAYGYLSESTHQMFKTDGHRRAATAESELAEGETAGAVHNGQFDAVDNPIWSAEESPTKGAFGFHDDDLEGNRERQGSSPSLSGRKGFGHHEDDSERMESVNLMGVAKSGYLMKRSTHKSWLRRWFFIKEGKMYYTHKAVDGTPNGSKNISAVPVANLLISTVRNASNKEFQIISPGQRGIGVGGGVYELMGENDEDAADWVRVIRLQIEGSLTKNLPNAGDSPHLSDAQSSSALVVPVAAVLSTLYAANPACVDCGARNPNWASLNLCVMMCIECSGIHRSLGSHISKVRSVTLDKWSSNAIQLLTAIGNQNANRIWESSLSDRNVKRQLIGPTADREARELFITRKYVKRAYMDADRAGGHDAATNVNDLLRASAAGDLLAVMRQLAAGTDVNATVVVAHSSDVVSNNRKTPLILACENNQVLCVELLCQWGASAEVRDGSGLSAFDVARQQRNQDILDIFAAASGDSRDRSGSGRKASR